MIDLMGYMDNLKRMVRGEEPEVAEGAIACHLGPGPHTALPLARMRFYWSLPEEMASERKTVRIRRFFSRLGGLKKTA